MKNFHWNIFVLISLIQTISYTNAKKKGKDHKDKDKDDDSSDLNIKCKDGSGKDVDWFIAYKLPKISASTNVNVKEGVAYAYLLPDSETQEFTEGHHEIGSEHSMLGITLKHAYDKDNDDELMYLMYNDQPPDLPTKSNGAHAKGVILSTASEGIWLQHSVPHYPPSPKEHKSYSYPDQGTNNGQTLHCMSLSPSQLDSIVGEVLNVTQANVYASHVPKGLHEKFPVLKGLANNEHHHHKGRGFNGKRTRRNSDKGKKHSTPSTDPVVFEIKNGKREITSFAKAPDVEVEIYSEWIAPHYKNDVQVQSWLNGRGALDSNCFPAYKVYNVKDSTVIKEEFTTHKDHSKWAIVPKNDVVCIGDLNRADHQLQRGGSVNCFMDKVASKAYEKIVVNTMPCPSK